jgi:hypothetical protein
MSDAPARNTHGQYATGSTGNPRGRPKGSLNATTVLANQRLRARADKAARVLERCLNSLNEWVALSAAKTILERGADAGDGSDTTWIGHATREEVRIIHGIMKACQARASRGIVRNEMAEIPGWHGTKHERDDELRYGDAFDALSLPAPRLAEPAPAPEPASDELVIDVAAEVVGE